MRLTLLFMLFLLIVNSVVGADTEVDWREMQTQMRALSKTLQVTKPNPGSYVYYKNGAKATGDFARAGAYWYWPNGQKITGDAGRRGAYWYWPNGQKISGDMGRKGAYWYYPDGKKITSNGPEVSEDELLDVPSKCLDLLEMLP
ncbi:hypothetical protein IV102_38155 [bacterium]|nr:hypothetical protein [bacterium]